ncbi:MAG: tetratricopeptide repeat protein [Myxococcales bacterium]|nr:tetratricopeptide repeat protein [Myxococcales bacterium]MDH5305880.1 tetratricopeptide repeat protein [Myxococcales bacterium]MDH5565340.1 tetratricopeptide repeat protein [Myxococcales bacterium]
MLALQVLACAGMQRDARALHVEEVAAAGDAARRASTRLVLEGLAADSRQQPDRALSQYERALQIDSGNAVAYLALARHHIEQRDAPRALAYLDHAQLLYESTQADSPRVSVHLLGLRGNALQLEGRMLEGDALLVQAARRAPDVWGDGFLSADELR